MNNRTSAVAFPVRPRRSAATGSRERADDARIGHMILRHVTMSLDASPPARTTRWTGSSNTASRSRDTVRRRHVLALLAPALLAPAGCARAARPTAPRPSPDLRGDPADVVRAYLAALAT